MEHVLHAQNTHANALARLASATTTGIDDPIKIEVVHKPRPPVEVFETHRADWMQPILQYLTTGQVPDIVKSPRGFHLKALHYTVLNGMLYKRRFNVPLLRCMDEHTTQEMLDEFHQGTCDTHEGMRTLASRILHYGYYWLRLHQDAKAFVTKCDQYQRFANLGNWPTQSLHPIVTPAPFDRWGLDFIGPFPMASWQRRFILIDVDFFSK